MELTKIEEKALSAYLDSINVNVNEHNIATLARKAQEGLIRALFIRHGLIYEEFQKQPQRVRKLVAEKKIPHQLESPMLTIINAGNADVHFEEHVFNTRSVVQENLKAIFEWYFQKYLPIKDYTSSFDYWIERANAKSLLKGKSQVVEDEQFVQNEEGKQYIGEIDKIIEKYIQKAQTLNQNFEVSKADSNVKTGNSKSKKRSRPLQPLYNFDKNSLEELSKYGWFRRNVSTVVLLKDKPMWVVQPAHNKVELFWDNSKSEKLFTYDEFIIQYTQLAPKWERGNSRWIDVDKPIKEVESEKFHFIFKVRNFALLYIENNIGVIEDDYKESYYVWHGVVDGYYERKIFTDEDLIEEATLKGKKIVVLLHDGYLSAKKKYRDELARYLHMISLAKEESIIGFQTEEFFGRVNSHLHYLKKDNNEVSKGLFNELLGWKKKFF